MPKAKHFSCTGSAVKRLEYCDLGDGWIKLHEVFSDGTTSGKRLKVLKGANYIKLQEQDGQEREKIFGAGYSGNHVRYFPERNQFQFWSQGGGKLGPNKMYMT